MANNEKKCPFCGSKDIYLQAPYTSSIAGEPEYDYCCLPQKKNHEYASKHFHPIMGKVPTQEEIQKL